MTPAARDLSVYFGSPPKDPEARDLMAALEYEHPHVAERIKATWGDPLCMAYMRDLLMPDHVSAFHAPKPLDALSFRTLNSLIELHDKLHPMKSDIWERAE